MRGQGDLNEQKIRDIAATFTKDDQSTEVDFYDGILRVSVKSTSVDTDFRFAEIETALRPLIPAHIPLVVERAYATWRDLLTPLHDWATLTGVYQDWRAVKSILAEV